MKKYQEKKIREKSLHLSWKIYDSQTEVGMPKCEREEKLSADKALYTTASSRARKATRLVRCVRLHCPRPHIPAKH